MHLIKQTDPFTPTATSEPWVDLSRVAQHLGFAYQSTARMAKQGVIPGRPFKRGKRTFWRFRLSDVDAALMQNNNHQK
jgi:hypothetical protein